VYVLVIPENGPSITCNYLRNAEQIFMKVDKICRYVSVLVHIWDSKGQFTWKPTCECDTGESQAKSPADTLPMQPKGEFLAIIASQHHAKVVDAR
jgi:hypothetical protein